MCRIFITSVFIATVAVQCMAGVVANGTVAGEIQLSDIPEPWKVAVAVNPVASGIEKITLDFSSAQERELPRFKVALRHSLQDCVGHWRTGAAFGKYITQTWRGEANWSSSLASQAPVVAFYNAESVNRWTIACSEALRKVVFKTGIDEEAMRLAYYAEFFTEPEAPMKEYRVEFLVDCRDVFYATAIRGAFDWCVETLGGDSRHIAPAAFDPLYSFWYSYHQNVSADTVEKECRQAVKYPMKTIIVDDGWQTDDNNGGYAFCGDWKVSKNRFPDFATHIAKVQAMGLKYMLWYSVPFIGKHSENFAKFNGKYLYHDAGLGASVLDPRFPEVREFLVGIYERALTEWGLDGLKLDFIDSFCFRGPDPAVAQGYAGRDIKSLPLAIDKLMTEIVERCNEIRPGILLEFRQGYVGPAIRRYGNMMRVADCAYGLAQNRVGSIDLRLSSGPLAVHSDMIIWDMNASPETAALQFLNIIFAVPQISVRLEELPSSHRKMLKGWLDFWMEHRDTLMFGELCPMRPDLNYPIVYAYGKDEQVIAVYDSGQAVRIDSTKGKAYVVNATSSDSLLLDVDGKPMRLPIKRSSFQIVQ